MSTIVFSPARITRTLYFYDFKFKGLKLSLIIFTSFFIKSMPYSFHSHSGQFCKHGHGLLEDVVKEAIRKGFHVYGLSEHMPRYADSELYPEEIEVYNKR